MPALVVPTALLAALLAAPAPVLPAAAAPLLPAAAAPLLAGPAVTADADDADLRVLSFDVVQLVDGQDVPGRADVFVDHRGFRYHFASEASKARFLGKPQLFEVQLGGACARMGPLSGQGRPEFHAVHEGRVYLFASEACRETFLANPAALLPREEPPVAADAEQRAAGDALLARALAAHGGAAVDALATFFAEHTRRLGTDPDDDDARPYTVGQAWYARFGPTGVDDLCLVDGWFYDNAPDDGWQRDCVSTPRDSWIREDGGVRPMHASQRRELRGRFARHPLAILRARAREDFVAAPAGPGAVRGAITERVHVSFAGATSTLDLGADGRILAVSWIGRGPDARIGPLTRTYGDYREVGGVWLPHAHVDTFEQLPGPERAWHDVRVDVPFRGMFER